MFGILMQWELTGKQLLEWNLLGLCAVLKTKNFFSIMQPKLVNEPMSKKEVKQHNVKRNLSVNNL